MKKPPERAAGKGAEDVDKAAKTYREELEAELAKRKEAARRILAVSTELHLTWREFEEVLERVKGIAYFSSGSEPVSTS